MRKGELLFSVTKRDLRVDTFRAGGPGGQNQNKRETGVRIAHPASGAVAESREFRTQEQNKAAAFRRLVASPQFKRWHKVETARRLGLRADAEAEVERQLQPRFVRTEVRVGGRWVLEPVAE